MSRTSAPLAVWAGVECTVNRVRDAYCDQLERSGHAARFDDLDRIAALGVRVVRYPVLWERTAPCGLPGADWSWPDARLARLRALEIEPIVGLLHHGSGPRDTSLLDPRFPERLAAFARAVAERYPWVERWTPINEPLTTSRFSTRYGHWYPHVADDASFARSVLLQCRAIAAAMRAIRAAAPQARLVLTEDLGRVYATPRLAYQAAFENERRWLTFDVLCGRFAPGHPMWDFFRWAGVGAGELAAAADECAGEGPEMLGVNHYLTGERFLDERLERYPPRAHGGNGRDAYADVEAARVRAEGIAGPYALLHEAWARYRRPLAITEVHLGCTREQQLRWLAQAWDAALAARADGVDVRAVTAWSLFGAFDWASLMTRADGLYEAGAFDVRAPAPRPTAVATVVRQLASRGAYDHPAAAGPGWWETDARLAYPAVSAGPADPRPPVRREPARTILVTGATGTLGRAIARRCAARGLAHQLLSRCELDIAEPRDVARVLDAEAPWALVNAAGYVRVDDAELARDACFRANARGAAVLAEACAARGVRFVTFSSDLVFDGARGLPYRESDAPAPRGVYGASKAEAERRVAALCPSALVVRTSAFFGPWDEHNFVVRVLRALAAAETVVAADDVVVSPTYVPDLADVVLDLLIDGASGLWHLANAGAMTWAELARDAARRAGLDAARVDGCPTSALRLRAERPRYSALASERAALMPPLGEALDRFVRAWRAPAAEPAGAPARAAAP